jgi:hypothetical protein
MTSHVQDFDLCSALEKYYRIAFPKAARMGTHPRNRTAFSGGFYFRRPEIRVLEGILSET